MTFHVVFPRQHPRLGGTIYSCKGAHIVPQIQSQFPAIISLSSLNGQNGVKFTGENPNDQSGEIVSSTGDINGDGIMDFIIGAPGVNNSCWRKLIFYLGVKHPGHHQ